MSVFSQCLSILISRLLEQLIGYKACLVVWSHLSLIAMLLTISVGVYCSRTYLWIPVPFPTFNWVVGLLLLWYINSSNVLDIKSCMRYPTCIFFSNLESHGEARSLAELKSSQGWDLQACGMGLAHAFLMHHSRHKDLNFKSKLCIFFFAVCALVSLKTSS